MQHAKLKEIIWEITDQCNQNCSYCGSKDSINKTPIDEDNIKAIVDNIASYSPEEINISGGNPLMLYENIHEYIVKGLPNTNCKIIVNPFNIAKADPSTRLNKLALYKAIGLSVNTVEELEYCLKQLSTGKWNKLTSKITIITNFNTTNIWNFDAIEKLVITYGFVWQVQYTMYKSKSDMAVYQNTDADKYLRDKILQSKAKIVTADNMNGGSCSAGLYSVGILANGDVIPCLSMRSWDTETKFYGNLLESSLKDVWEYGFCTFRCNEFKCCKDVTGCMTKNIEMVQIPSNFVESYIVADPPEIQKNITMMYGVFNNQVFVYGTVDPWKQK